MVAEVHRFMGGNGEMERHQVETRLPKGEYDDPSATVVHLASFSPLQIQGGGDSVRNGIKLGNRCSRERLFIYRIRFRKSTYRAWYQAFLELNCK